jgi:hypothetical protein
VRAEAEFQSAFRPAVESIGIRKSSRRDGAPILDNGHRLIESECGVAWRCISRTREVVADRSTSEMLYNLELRRFCGGIEDFERGCSNKTHQA